MRLYHAYAGAAGQDQFPMDLVNRVLGRHEVYEMHDVFCCGDLLNMTYLALNLSHYVNGVAKKHGEISSLCLPATQSTRSPTVFTPRAGRRIHSRSFTIAMLAAGVRTISACVMR